MKFKKILNILIAVSILMSTISCSLSYAATDIKTKQKQTREKINKLKWLEGLETNKLYKNQQKLEAATNNLSNSKTEIIEMQKKLNSLESQLNTASYEYIALNKELTSHIKNIYKNQRKARFQVLLTSDDINMLVDRIYYQRVIVQKEEANVIKARQKAQEIATLRYDIISRKNRLERSVASINSQQDYIKKAIAKNESMINKLKTDRRAYEKAERELEQQSNQIGNYINRSTSKNSDTHVAAGFIKPIQGRITSPFGYRIHPIHHTRSFHSGVDIGGPNLGVIKASNDGKVIYSGWYGGYGKVVILDHGTVNGKPLTTLYAHMSSTAVSNGTQVRKGQVLGYEGTTGYSTGPHCHFEVRVNGKPDSPGNYVQGI